MSITAKRGNLVPVRRNDNATTDQIAPSSPDGTLSAWNPWREMADMDRWFSDFMGRSFDTFGLAPRWPLGQAYGRRVETAAEAPTIDLYETPDELIVFAYAPGANKDAFDIAVGNGVLTLRGERRPLIEGENLTGYGSGIARMQGTFEATYRLPVDVDAGKARATYTDGVLHLHLPKSEAAKVKHIKVAVQS